MNQPTAMIITSVITFAGNAYIAWYNKRASATATATSGSTATQARVLKLMSRMAMVLAIAVPFGGLLWVAYSAGPVTPATLSVAIALGSLLICSFVLLVAIFVTSKTVSRDVVVQLGSLTINDARYGTGDRVLHVTDAVRRFILDGRVEMPVANAVLCGSDDPCPGVHKQLIVDYVFNGKEHSTTVKEGNILLLP